ncbi:ribonuclease H family protein [Chryseobacterium sp. CKR4-1]|uniref:ribonuclease H family protein n=1 Tax=Chryseobacterium sp. CKR4-1 TaxID=3068896 RepID=UPI0027964D25|nr:ribonuclease H family protein [Chryseobacterium sp. CKR4-1]MDQ1806011.1 ribonuclease H family protein [Chryseobacterium sp. CKR4-1]
MGKQKFYVVWKGHKTGVFDSWEECKEQTNGFPNAEFKSFQTRELAEKAFNSDSKEFVGIKIFEPTLSKEELALIGDPIEESISVDGACNVVTGIVEYQGVDTKTKKVLFKQGPFEGGTNNIGEFLAIVHGLAYCKKKNINIPIYSDSKNAMSWVKNKKVKTSQEKNDKNKELFDLIDRAIKWLENNERANKILKWETKAWGENPADFGRK